eukprot:8359171-Karenia_brevis.AAC.1
MVELGATVKRSMRQQVLDVVGFKLDMEKCRGNVPYSSGQISKLYLKHVKYARSSEPVSPAFMDSAITLHARVFSTVANDVLVWAD